MKTALTKEEHDRVEALNQLGKHKASETFVTDLLAKYPNDAYLLYMLGDALFNQNKFERANESFDASIEQDPNNDQAFYMKGLIAVRTGNYKEAVQYYNEAIRLYPDDAYYFAGLSHAMAEESPEEALLYADKALEINPNLVYGLNVKAFSLREMNKYKEAEEAYETMLQLAPNEYDTHNNFGWMFLESGDAEKALQHLKIALQILPTYTNSSGNPSIYGLRKANEALLPENWKPGQFKYVRELLNSGKLLQRSGKLKEAQTLFETALQENPNYDATHVDYGWCSLKQSEYEKALHHFKRVLELDPANREYYAPEIVKVIELLEKGEYEKAQEYYRY